MEKLTSLTAVAAPLPIDNCDTDQIMPKQFLRGIDKSGLARGVFFNMRCNPDGSPRADCVFNRPGFEKTAIICAGPNFGCGSSREHAAAIMAALSDTTPVELTVDLVAQEIRAGDGVWSFEVAPRHRTMLMEGLDMIAATLRDMDEIERFRAVHEAEFPWMTGLAGKAKRRLEGR